MSIQDQKFGIEIEMTGITRNKAAKVIAKHFNTQSEHYGGTYDKYIVHDNRNREWSLVYDSSISAYNAAHRSASQSHKVEFVSPICEYSDIETIQKIVRELKQEGAFANNSCGIHVHVDASRFDVQSLKNLTNIMYSKEDMIYRSLQVHVSRENTFCKKIETSFLEKLNRNKPHNLDELSSLWYSENNGGSRGHYDRSRYHALNLHSVFSKGTVEFRLFNGTLHAGRIKTYIQLSLAICNQALSQSKASRIKTQSTNEKYTFRTWLLRLGMIGDEFETARYFLLKNLEGCIAWRDPEQAVAQRERLIANRNNNQCENEQPTQEDSQVMSM